MLKVTNPEMFDLLTIRLNDVLGANEKGEVTLGRTPGVAESLSELLADYIQYSRELSVRRRAQITWRALLDSKRAGDLNRSGILRRAAEKQTEFLRKSRERYVMLTSASITYETYLEPIDLDGARIEFLPHRPTGFTLPHNQGRDVEYKIPPRQTHVTVAVTARDPLEGAEIAFDRLLLWRGIWNLVLNCRTAMRISFGEGHSGRPVNQIAPGPLYTMHHAEGQLALKEQWWHTPGLEAVQLQSLNDSYRQIKKFEKWIRSRLTNAAIGSELTRFLTLYCSACDEPELSSAYLALWAVLEQITGTGKGSYDDLVRRASFLYHDVALARAMLQHLRNQRNGMVHRGVSVDAPERVVYLVKRYVEDSLIFLLRNASRFQTMEEFKNLLDLPPDPSRLRERLNLLRRAYRMRDNWRRTAQSRRPGRD